MSKKCSTSKSTLICQKLLRSHFLCFYQNLQQLKALACSPAHEVNNSCLPYETARELSQKGSNNFLTLL